MPVDSNIQDPYAGHRARVNGEGALKVAQAIPDTPAIGEVSRQQYDSSLLGTTGADSGTTSMNVDGSVTPVEFYVEAADEYDIRITRMSVIMVDGSIAYNKFGALLALTNGFSISLKEAGVITSIIDSAKTTGELITEVGQAGNFITLANFNATNENAFILEIDIASIVPDGLRIGRGTLDRVFATVSDDLTGLTDLTVKIIGYKHYPIKET